jgi:hypothetical protein
MKPLFMPFRRPQDTLISGIGVAAAVLAAVVVTFALVSGFVAFSLTSVDQLPRSSDALVLSPLRTKSVAVRPLVLRRAHAPTAQRRSAPPAAAAAAAPGATGTRKPAVVALSPQAVHGSGPKPAPQRHAGDGAAPSVHPAPDRLLQPVGDAIGATGQAVGATTESLARRIDTVAATAGATVAETRELLRTTVDRSGRVVGRPLGAPPPG